MVKISLVIIAICEVIRAMQNMIQIRHIGRAEKVQIDAYGEFVKSLNKSDRETVKEWLEALENTYNEDAKKCACNCNNSHKSL